MDDCLREFLTESAEHLETVDAELVRFERDPTGQAVLRHVFRLVHTVKGTCGFLGLPRLEALAHAAETLMGRFRDGAPVSAGAVTLVLSTLDRLKGLLGALEATGAEPDGDDAELVGALERMAEAALAAPATSAPPTNDGRTPRHGKASLAALEVVGLLNLRGRVVTALSLRRRLGLPGPGHGGHGMAVGLEQGRGRPSGSSSTRPARCCARRPTRSRRPRRTSTRAGAALRSAFIARTGNCSSSSTSMSLWPSANPRPGPPERPGRNTPPIPAGPHRRGSLR